MSKDKRIFGAVVTVALGAALIFGNGSLTTLVLAADESPQPPVVVSDNAFSIPEANGTIMVRNEQGKIFMASNETVMEAWKDALDASGVASLVYVEGTPSESDLTEEKATEIAIPAIAEKYALAQKTLNRFTVTIKYYAVYEDVSDEPVWWINLYPTNTNDFTEIGCYTAIISAGSGDVIKLMSAADGRG